jgi:CRP-like cAMP-binding protein
MSNVAIAHQPHPAAPVERLLHSLCSLSQKEREIVRRLTSVVRRSRAGDELCGADWSGARVCFLVAGWACRLRILADGRRQIFSILLPGDLVNCQRLMSFGTSIAAVALTPVVTVEAKGLLDAADDPANPGLGCAVELLEAREERGLLDHIVRLGRLTAYERVAHWLLDVRDRLELVGLAGPDGFPMPLTQETLADVLGLSNVHVNRVLQQLRRDGMLALESGRARLLRAKALALACGYSAPGAP